jgi:hypothetical protein
LLAVAVLVEVTAAAAVLVAIAHRSQENLLEEVHQQKVFLHSQLEPTTQ